MDAIIALIWSLINALPQGSVSGGAVLALFIICLVVGVFFIALNGKTGAY